MGQYQQWLYYQEVDQRLRADLEALDIELAHIQEQLCSLEQFIPSTDNVIIRTLAAGLNGHTDVVLSGERSRNSSRSPDTAIASPSETISPALYGWGGLPNFGREDMQEPLSQPQNSIAPTSHPEMVLLPEDMVAFFDAHDQTEPQLELPWWLSKVAASANVPHSPHPIDREGRRNNSQIQRWRERWGRPVSMEQPSAKSEDTAHE